MNLKFLLPIAIDLMKRITNSPAADAIDPTLLIKKAIHDEIVSISIKIICGIILCGLILFSLIVIAQQINLLLMPLPNGPILAILFFSLVTVLCGIGFGVLFRRKDLSEQENEIRLASKKNPFDNDTHQVVHNVVQSFLSGLAKGYKGSAEPYLTISRNNIVTLPTRDKASSSNKTSTPVDI